MTRYNKVSVTSGKNIASDVNRELTKISTAIDDTLSRRHDLPNSMQSDFDLNSNDLLNGGAISAQSLSINGQNVVPTDLAVSTLPDQTGHAGEILHTNGTTAYWDSLASASGVINLDDYITNDSAASSEFQDAVDAAVASGKALVSYDCSRTYELDAQVDARGLKNIKICATIETTAIDNTVTDGCIILGGLSLSVGGRWEIANVTSSNKSDSNNLNGYTPYPQIDIRGAKGIHMEFGNIAYVRVYHDYTGGSGSYTQSGTAYNQIFVNGRIGRWSVDSVLKTTDPLWFNENTFWGGRWYKIDFIDQGYPHNHNKWIRPLFEDSQIDIDIGTGTDNMWEDCRFEGSTAAGMINFAGIGLNGRPTSNNRITRSWTSSLQPRETVQDWSAFNGQLVDNGMNNQVYYDHITDYTKHEIINLSGNISVISDDPSVFNGKTSSLKAGVFGRERSPMTFANQRPVYPSGQGLYCPYPYTRLAESGLIPVSYGDVFSVQATISQGHYRCYIVCYDSDGLPLDDSSALNAPSWTYVSNGQWQTSDRTAVGSTGLDAFHVDSTDVAYISIVASTGSTTDTIIQDYRVVYFEKANVNKDTPPAITKDSTNFYLNSAPTMGFAPEGSICNTPNGNYECLLAVVTELAAEAANGASSISVDHISESNINGTVADGDIVGIELNDGTCHWTTINGTITGSGPYTITLTDTVASPAGTVGAKGLSNGKVYFVRWENTGVTVDGGNAIAGFPFPSTKTTANRNVVMGTRCFEALTDGSDNTGMGRYVFQDLTGGDNNVAMGAYCGRDITDGYYNVTIGSGCSDTLTTGYYNTVIGGNSGKTITTGHSNTILGYLCEPSSATAVNQIVLGVGVTGTVDNQFSFGKLNNVVDNNFDTDALWTRTSDENYKIIHGECTLGLDFLLDLKTIAYSWKEGHGNTEVNINGFGARHTKATAEKHGDPDWLGVRVTPDGEHKMSNESLIPILVKAVQELTERVKELEGR